MVGAAPRDWDGARYDRLSDPQVRMALPVLDRLVLRGDETVLDAGCGSGRVTELLLERLPRGRVIAVDASASMIEQAVRRLQRYGERVRLVRADLQAPLPSAALVGGEREGGGMVDAVLSTATFHWIKDHEALFRNLAAVMKPGAQLVFQCGGEGNIASVVAALREMGETWEGPWNFAGPEETRRRLERAGFEEVRCWLTPEPVTPEPGEALETFLATIVLGAHLDRLPERERAAYVREVARRLPNPERPVLDYVRLNATARRAVGPR
jgi:trans-aconitate 2-methyltransferase